MMLALAIGLTVLRRRVASSAPSTSQLLIEGGTDALLIEGGTDALLLEA